MHRFFVVARKRGFTLVEIMIVVAVVALLAVIAMPGFKAARDKSMRVICIDHLRAIDSAKDRFILDRSDGRPPESLDELVPQMNRRVPYCPAGGEYTIGGRDEPPTCSKGAELGHVLGETP